ncbi:MAG: AAA family ATPase [Erysipelotrichaceae bacterium]|nr:AAA family ATPase [Erysipelotrichaceae bacterium]
MYTNIYPREKYLSRLRPFYSSDIIKVITGIRRCGKSCIMKAIINELLSNGVDSAHIIYIPLDKRGFKEIKKPEQLEARIESMISGGGLFGYLKI